MCDSHNSDKVKKGDEDMNTAVDTDTTDENLSSKRMQISSEAIENLLKRKTVIECKDGVAQIDKDHPDYNFWMED